MSLDLANQTDRTLQIVGIEPTADEGLEVEYIGYSSCRRGCAGVQYWTPETQEQVELGLDGTYPVPVPPDRGRTRVSAYLPERVIRIPIADRSEWERAARESA